jgi:hypothetical protein
VANKNPVNQFGVGNKAAAKPGGPRVKMSATLSQEAYNQLDAIAVQLGMNKSDVLDAAILAFAKVNGLNEAAKKL